MTDEGRQRAVEVEDLAKSIGLYVAQHGPVAIYEDWKLRAIEAYGDREYRRWQLDLLEELRSELIRLRHIETDCILPLLLSER